MRLRGKAGKCGPRYGDQQLPKLVRRVKKTFPHAEDPDLSARVPRFFQKFFANAALSQFDRLCARYRKVTICARVHGSFGLKVVELVPAAIPRAAAQRTAEE